MRWPRRKREKVQVDLDTNEAIQAAEEADSRLTETRARWPEVIAITDRLTDIRERNHLSEGIRRAVLGGRDQ